MEGWRTETSIGFNLTVFEGGHFFFQHHLDAIANLISSHLAAHQVS
jgi:surfactin synthase thioesterase subunit